MSSNPNIVQGELYCNTSNMTPENFLAFCLQKYKLKHNCKPQNIQISQANQTDLQEYEAIKILYDRETPKNHVFMVMDQ